MDDIGHFGVMVGLVGLALLAAVSSHWIAERIRVPAPALFLVLAAVASDLFPALNALDNVTNQRLVTVGLIFVLFDGGMHIGWRQFRPNAGAIVWLGVAGTAVTTVALALAAHSLLGFSWPIALLIGTALAPTDPAVVFSVLGRREISGRSGTLLEGESGANDPVGIAAMVALLSATGSGAHAVWSGLGIFALEMAVGSVVGLAAGWAMIWLFRRALPSEALYLVRSAAAAALVYGLAVALGGSGFLAVLLAGIVVGDARIPYRREVERFAAGLSGVGEILAFTVLGLSISLRAALAPDVLWPGLLLAALMIFVVRPVLVGLTLLPIRLALGERVFVLWAGLKGAVPILLGAFLLSADVTGARRIYEIIFVVVLVSVVLQGGLVPTVARWCRVPMRTVGPEPWALGMRFSEEPNGLQRVRVGAGSPADGSTVQALELGEQAWISMVSRDGALVHLRGTTELRAGDEVLALADPDTDLGPLFSDRRRDGGTAPTGSGQ